MNNQPSVIVHINSHFYVSFIWVCHPFFGGRPAYAGWRNTGAIRWALVVKDGMDALEFLT